eukprot:1192862-Amphidinium_carterae.2
MRIMSVLFVSVNRFAGTLPNRAVAGLDMLLAQENGFEGKHRHKMSQTQCLFRDTVICYFCQFSLGLIRNFPDRVARCAASLTQESKQYLHGV